jgi:hypothetical protein
VPESTTSFRETARLKDRLTKVNGKKRAREEESGAQKRLSDDEEESRAGAIQQKAKVASKAKNSKNVNTSTPISELSSPKHAFSQEKFTKAGPSDTKRLNGQVEPIMVLSSPENLVKKRKKKRKKLGNGAFCSSPASPSQTVSSAICGNIFQTSTDVTSDKMSRNMTLSPPQPSE